MRRLVALTVVGALLLAAAVAVLYGIGRTGLAAEAARLEREAAGRRVAALEAVQADVAGTLADLLDREARRPYYHYRGLYVPPDLVAQQVALVPSPLAEPPREPLVQVYFEFRGGRLESPASFAAGKGQGSAFAAASWTVLQELGRRTAALEEVLAAASGPRDEVVETLVDAYVCRVNGDPERALLELERDSPLQRENLNAEWRDYQSRVGKQVGSYAPEQRVSAESVQVRLHAFRWLSLGRRPDGWPEHALAVRRVEVGGDSWLQGFALDLAATREQALGDAIVRVSQGAAGEPALASPLAWSESSLDDGAPGRPRTGKGPVPPVVAATARAAAADPEALGLEAPLDGLALVYVGETRAPERLLRGSRGLLDGALALVGAVVLVGGAILVGAARGQRRLAQQRADFVAALTHELKAPLTGLRALAEMLHDGLVPDEARRQEYYAAMLDESERLGRLVQNVLEAARLERGALRVVAERLDPAPLLADLAARFRSRLEPQGFAFAADLPPALPPVLGDREALTQVVGNLLDNAAKYGRGAERRVRLEARVAGGQLELRVSDRGPGIPLRERERIFGRFYRSPAAPREVGGAGLGLTIARAQARALGGDLVVVDPPDGVGACFRLTLPLAP